MAAKQLPLVIACLALACVQVTIADDQGVKAGTAAPTWSLETPSGEAISFPHAHDGPVILLFWASWCPYCKALMPHLQSMLDEYDDDALTIYAINFRDDGDPIAYLQKHGFDFTLLLDGGDVAAAYDIHATPGLLIFDSENRVILDLYDVMDDYNDMVTLSDDLNHGQKAARKTPWWAAQVRLALDQI